MDEATTNPDQVSLREKSLPEKDIDQEFIGRMVVDAWRKTTMSREDFMRRREEWTANWRDLRAQPRRGPWDGSSNYHLPLTLIYGKAIHARLWQLFSDKDFFGVTARRVDFAEQEDKVRQFMQYVLSSYVNFGQGTRDVFDEMLWDNVFEGSGYVKMYWGREKYTYSEVIPVLETTETLTFDRENVSGLTGMEKKFSEKEEVRTEVRESPQIKRMLIDDIMMPIGQNDPQTSDYFGVRVYMDDHYLKMRAQEGKFYRDVVEEVIEHKSNVFTQVDVGSNAKLQRADMDGYDTQLGDKPRHIVIEWYGKAYVESKIDEQELVKDIDKLPEEIVAWVHFATGKVLGWTYLHRISPDGTRPVFKSDYIRFPDRTDGVGIAELLQDTNDAIDSNYNLRNDNGVLSSMPIGFYRASSGLKPDTIRYQPGTFYPVDDTNDVSIKQFPFLGNFGYQEEERLNSYAERLTSIDDLQLGRSPQKVGVFRSATGANAINEASNVQLEIHFDRLARMMGRMLSCLFKMCRERMPGTLYYRVMGEDGMPIFGHVNREDLKGDFDFDINVDVLAASRTEKQQQATLLTQTLINPGFTQSGVVTQTNLYNIAKQVLKANRIQRVADFITPPPDYTGSILSPQERIHMIIVGNYNDPPIEDTVRMSENHEQALKVYEGFKTSEYVGLLSQRDQLAALARLEQRHQQMMQAVQAGGNPNMSGMQTPRDGFAPIGAQGGTGQASPVQAPQGEANGPVA